MSRGEIEIDFKVVDKLLMSGCSGIEIAAYLGIHHDTLYDRVQNNYGKNFSSYSAEKRSKGDSLLKDVQFDKAINGDNTLLIWLGKNRLGQKDKSNEEKDGDLIADLRKFVAQYTKNTLSIPDTEQPQRSNLENQQPLLHQGPCGEKSTVQPQLGTERTT